MENKKTRDVIQFLEIAIKKGYLNRNTGTARKTACTKLFDILEEDEDTVGYVFNNIDTIKGRYLNLHPEDVSGTTVEEYKRRCMLAIKDFTDWTKNRAQWEQKVQNKSKKQTSSKTTAKTKVKKIIKLEESKISLTHELNFEIDGKKVKVSLPKNFKRKDLMHLGHHLAPYCEDFFNDNGSVEPAWPDPVNKSIPAA